MGIIKSWSLVEFAKEFGKMQINKCDSDYPYRFVSDKGVPTYVRCSKKLGLLTAEEIMRDKSMLRVVQLEEDMDYRLCRGTWEEVDLGITYPEINTDSETASEKDPLQDWIPYIRDLEEQHADITIIEEVPFDKFIKRYDKCNISTSYYHVTGDGEATLVFVTEHGHITTVIDPKGLPLRVIFKLRYNINVVKTESGFYKLEYNISEKSISRQLDVWNSAYPNENLTSLDLKAMRDKSRGKSLSFGYESYDDMDGFDDYDAYETWYINQ